MENKDIEQYIIDLMQVQCQVKVFHWQTKIYGKHIALDRLFDAIIDNIDEFTETAMGKYGRVDFSGVSYTFDNIARPGANGFGQGDWTALRVTINSSPEDWFAGTCPITLTIARDCKGGAWGWGETPIVNYRLAYSR